MHRLVSRGRLSAAVGVSVSAALLLAGCSAGGSGDGDVVIRVALGSSGDAVDSYFEVLKDQYEEKFPGRTVEIIVQEDDVYQTTGLTTLLASREAPDAFFEWSGPRMRNHVEDGNGADLTEALGSDKFTGRFDDGAFNNMDVDGKGIHMVPWTGDVTNVIWYSKDVFDELGLTVPSTWDEFIAVSSAIKDAGITPMVAGNKDQWPLGNWASHVVSRVVGEDAYAAAMDGEAPLNSAEMIAALETYGEIAPYLNNSVSALPDDEANTQFFLGQAAMLAIGSWLMADAATDAEGLDFDYFDTPPITGGAGDQTSVLGISTGFIVNAKTEHFDETVDFLALLSAPEATKAWAAAGLAPMTIDPFDGVEADPRTVALAEMLGEASTLVAPADSGHDIEIAAAFYDAVASVSAGSASAQDALDTAQKRLDAAG